MRSPSRQSAATSSRPRQRAPASAAGSEASPVPTPDGARTMAVSLCATVAASSPAPCDQTNSSALQAPLTTPSPSPKQALTSDWSARPLTGLLVKSTPETRPATIRCTTTATRGSRVRAPAWSW